MGSLWILFSYLLNPIQGQYVAVAIVSLGIWFFGYLNKLGFRKGNLLKGLQYASPVLAGSLYSLILSIQYVKQYKLYIPEACRIASIIFQMLGISLFEEILFRAILLNTIMYIFRENRRNIYYAIIISSALFGLVHLSNLINRPEILIGTISQVIYATTMGVLYSIIYIKCKNIWPTIIIHALFNLMSVFPFIFLRVNYWLIIHYFLNTHSKSLIAFLDSILSIPYWSYILYLFKKLEINKDEKG
jgi:membrane protease YdiL (CAAX protease family)